MARSLIAAAAAAAALSCGRYAPEQFKFGYGREIFQIYAPAVDPIVASHLDRPSAGRFMSEAFRGLIDANYYKIDIQAAIDEVRWLSFKAASILGPICRLATWHQIPRLGVPVFDGLFEIFPLFENLITTGEGCRALNDTVLGNRRSYIFDYCVEFYGEKAVTVCERHERGSNIDPWSACVPSNISRSFCFASADLSMDSGLLGPFGSRHGSPQSGNADENAEHRCISLPVRIARLVNGGLHRDGGAIRLLAVLIHALLLCGLIWAGASRWWDNRSGGYYLLALGLAVGLLPFGIMILSRAS